MTRELIPEHELKQRAAALATVEDAGPGSEAALIAVSAGERLYAIPIEQVVEVLPPTRVCRVPDAAAVLEGIVNYRGDIVPALSLAAYFNHPAGRAHSVVVVAANGSTAAVVSGDTPRLLQVPADAIRGTETGTDATDRAVRGLIDDAGSTIAVLALEHIIRPGMFTRASSGPRPGAEGDVR